jgi:16S rRNA (guanine527-N7)-methyltransferase
MNPSKQNRQYMKSRSSGQPGIDAMIRLFEESGLELSDQAYHRFWTYHRLIRTRNVELDLTRIRRFEEMVLKHYVDCALIPTLIKIPSPMLDIGTGAGFPGIPLKIVHPRTEIVLSEGRRKRLDFLNECIKLLSLSGVTVYPHKISSGFDPSVSGLEIRGVITRALESIEKTLMRTARFLSPGAQAIFMKGPSCQPEIDSATDLMDHEYGLSEDISYSIPNSPHRRRLVVFTRKSVPCRIFYSTSKNADNQAINQVYGGDVCVKEICSRENPSFKTFLQILTGRGVRKKGLTLISGPRHVKEILEDFAPCCTGWLTHERDIPPPAEKRKELIWYRLSKELFNQIDLYGTGHPILLVKAPLFGEWSDEKKVPGCTLFIPFQDPANVGAVIRTAAAFGVSQVVILKEAAHPFHHKSIRVAGSTIFRVALLKGPSLGDLRSSEMPLFGLSPRGEDVAGLEFPHSFGLVPGIEGPGLPEDAFPGRILSIPMERGIDSMNAATATGIVLYLWHAGRRRF